MPRKINPKSLERAMRKTGPGSHPLFCAAYHSLNSTGQTLHEMLSNEELMDQIHRADQARIGRVLESITDLAKELADSYDYHCPGSKQAMTQRRASSYMYQHAHTLFEGLMQQAENTLVESEIDEIAYSPEERVAPYLDQLNLDAETRAEVIEYLKNYDLVDLAHAAFRTVHDEVAAEIRGLLETWIEAYTAAASAFTATLPPEQAMQVQDMLTTDEGMLQYAMSEAGMGAGASFADGYPWEDLATMGVTFDVFNSFVKKELPPYTEAIFDQADMAGLSAVKELIAVVVGAVRDDVEDDL